MTNCYCYFSQFFNYYLEKSSFYPNNKVTGCVFVCLSVCLYRMISLTAEPIGFSLTGQLLIGPGKVLINLGEGTTTLQREIAPRKN